MTDQEGKYKESSSAISLETIIFLPSNSMQNRECTNKLSCLHHQYRRRYNSHTTKM